MSNKMLRGPGMDAAPYISVQLQAPRRFGIVEGDFVLSYGEQPFETAAAIAARNNPNRRNYFDTSEAHISVNGFPLRELNFTLAGIQINSYADYLTQLMNVYYFGVAKGIETNVNRDLNNTSTVPARDSHTINVEYTGMSMFVRTLANAMPTQKVAVVAQLVRGDMPGFGAGGLVIRFNPIVIPLRGPPPNTLVRLIAPGTVLNAGEAAMFNNEMHGRVFFLYRPNSNLAVTDVMPTNVWTADQQPAIAPDALMSTGDEGARMSTNSPVSQRVLLAPTFLACAV